MRFIFYGFSALIVLLSASTSVLSADQPVRFNPSDRVPINAGDWNSLTQEKRDNITDHVRKVGLLSKTGEFMPEAKVPSLKEVGAPSIPVKDSFLCYACRSAKKTALKSCESAGNTVETYGVCAASAWSAGYKCCYE